MTYALAFLLILVPLVLIHEFGHFLICKLGGIRVTKFAFGFGNKLFGFDYKGTEYRWNLIPLGGYVDFMGDEVVYSDQIPDDVSHFYNKPKWLRFLVLVMGPAFNLVLAFALLWSAFLVLPSHEPVISGPPYTLGYLAPESPEALAGLQRGDQILSYDGRPCEEMGPFLDYILLNPKHEIHLQVLRDGGIQDISYVIPVREKEGIGDFGFVFEQRVVFYKVLDDMPAARAGFKEGDVILKIAGEPISIASQSTNQISKLVQANAPGPIVFTIERQGQVMDIGVSPERNDKGEWLVGFHHRGEFKSTDLGLKDSLSRTWTVFIYNSTLIYTAVKKLIVRELSTKALAGPLAVGQYAKESLDEGFWSFILLMAMLSLNLGLLNLLPIPGLDGGEIFVLAVEWITRRDFSLVTKMRIKLVGFVFLIGIMGMVIFNDILKVVT